MNIPTIVEHKLKDKADTLDTDLLKAMKEGDIERIIEDLDNGAILSEFLDGDDLEALKLTLGKDEAALYTSTMIIEELLENGTPEDIVQAVADTLKIALKKELIEELKPQFAQVSKHTIFKDSLRLLFFPAENNTSPVEKHSYITDKDNSGPQRS